MEFTTKTVASISVSSALVGVAIGYFTHAHIFEPMHVTLIAGAFSGRLMENSANFAQLKRNNISCLKGTLESRIRSDLEQVAFYRNYAASDARNVKAIDDATAFAREVLATANQKSPEPSSLCR